jgi:enoyl-CoA hydratase
LEATLSEDAAAPVLCERRGTVLWLTLNRPDRLNAVSLPLYRALIEQLQQLEARGDDAVRAVVLTGAGRAFCAGADLKAHAESELTEKQRRRYVRAGQRANRALQRCAVPCIAAVNGAAVGAGLELALSCDFMIVASNAKLRLPEIALGTFVGGGVMHTLPARVGHARATELLLLGDSFTGDDAAAMGLANRAVPADAVHETARALAERLAALAPVPLALARRLLRRAPRLRRREVMTAEARALARCMETEDWKEGVVAFREKRTPHYTGR